MPEDRVDRRLAAIFAGDIAGYSRLMGIDEEGTLRQLKGHRKELIDPKITEHRGRIVKTTGDGMLVEFVSVIDAVRCAVDIQRAMIDRNAGIPADKRVEFRVGINVGDIISDANDIYGDGVNVAARLEALAEPGGIMVSRNVYDQVRDKLSFGFEDMGEQTVKNIARPIGVHRISLSESAAPLVVKSAAATSKIELLTDRPSIAVLPFDNISGDPEQEYFADGISEDIIIGMSKLRWFFVISRNSSFVYKGKAIDVKRVGRELGVRYVLEGSVRKGGNRVRITTQLIDAISGTHVWADRYDRDLSDIFAVQDEITASVAGVIEPALAEAEQQRVLRKPPESLDAWEAYQRGLWHFNKYASEENQIALGFFRQAIGRAPNFAPGHYGYALALQWDIWHFSERPFAEVQKIPREEARIAVSLDDKDAMAHAVLAHMMMWGSEWEAAIAEARTALLLNPNSAFVISMLGCVLGFGGYHDEALDRLQQAMRASPHDPLIWLWTMWTGGIQLFSNKFEASLKTYNQLARLRPEWTHAQLLIASSLALLGCLNEARETMERIDQRLLDPRYRQR